MREVIIDRKLQVDIVNESKYGRDMQKRWEQQFPGVDRKTAVLLENQRQYMMNMVKEGTISTDLSGFYDVSIPIVRKILPHSITPNLVSVQPMTAPATKVFYYDPKVETSKGGGVYASMIDIHTGNSGYDINKGEYTVVNGADSGITASQFLSGASISLPYNGGVESLASLGVCLEYDQTGLSGLNSIVTTGTAGTSNPAPLGAKACIDDNQTTFWVTPNSNLTWVGLQLTGSTDATITTISWYNVNLPPSYVDISSSTDGSSWTLLSSYTPTWSVPERKYFQFSPSTEKYFRVGFSGSPVTAIYDLQLLGYETPDFTMNPQTWTEDLFSTNSISIKTHTTESWLSSSTITAFTQYRTYASNEAVSGVQEVQLNITGASVIAETRKLKSNWTDEMEENLKAYFGMGIEGELTDMMASEIATEIDREVIRDLIRIAPYETSWHYRPTSAITRTDGVVIPVEYGTSGRVTQQEWNQTLLTEVNKISGTIGKSNYNAEADWIVCSTKVGSVLEDNLDFFPVFNYDPGKLHKAGRLACKYDVYIDPFLPEDICLIGSKGMNDLDCGYIYSPYVPLQITGPVIKPDTLFEKTYGLMTRYGRKVINNKKYGLIRCSFPADDYDIINGD